MALDHQARWGGNKYRTRVVEILRRFAYGHILKVAQSAQFELEWLAWLFGPDVVRAPDWHCTLAQAYVLDERIGAMSLGDLTLLRFGFDVKALSPLTETSNLTAAPLGELLRYNGLDAKWTAPLFPLQEQDITKEKLHRVYAMQRERIPTLVLAMREGLLVDKAEVKKNQVLYGDRLEKVTAAIQKDKDVQEFKRRYGAFNPASPQQVVKFFRDFLGLGKTNRDGKFSTREDALMETSHPVAGLVVDWRGLAKMKSTYIDSIGEGGSAIHPDGRVHTCYKPTWTDTGRLSSEDLNNQNWPKRDEEQKKLRREITAPPGHVLLAYDMGQIEYRIIACASKDTKLIESLFEGFDVHLYWAERLAKAYPAALRRCGGKIDRLRNNIKSDMVFPAFYLSSIESIAKSIETPLKLAMDLFEEFWDMFAGVKKWQLQQLKFYEEFGYIEGLTGRRRHGPMSKSMVVNTPIQGVASDVVVDASNRLSVRAQEKGLPHYQMVLNIHDDLSFYVPKNRVEAHQEKVVKAMLNPPFDWVTVPLSVEVAMGPNWYDMKKVGVFSNVEEMKKRRGVA